MDSSRPKAWAELGAQLTARRRALGYGDFRQRADFHRDRAAGRFSYRTLTRLEKGERDRYPEETLDAVAEIYAVTPGSVRAVIDGKGDLEPSGEGSAAIPKPGIAASGTAGEPDEVAVMLPRIVAENWETNPHVRVLWSMDMPAEGRLGLIRKLLGLPENGGQMRSSG
jgi:hypothetical protein